MASFDIEQPGVLTAWLKAHDKIGADEAPRVTTLAGGVSNRTVLVERENGEAWVVKQALEKLRVQVDWFSSPERIHREALGLRWLAALAPAGTITPFIFEDFEGHLLAMAAVAQPHENWKTMLLRGELVPDHIEQFAGLLGSIHRESALRRDELEPVFGDRTFFETLRLEPYYEYAASQVSESAPFYAELLAETRGITQTIVHGDYSPKNVLVHEGRLVLLDHEVIHFGDPGFDLGFALTHLISKAHHLPNQRAAFAQAARSFWHHYERAVFGADWPHQLQRRAVRHTLACLLARVAGRSPLEYLDAAERERQRRIVTGLMAEPPQTVADLVELFIERL